MVAVTTLTPWSLPLLRGGTTGSLVLLGLATVVLSVAGMVCDAVFVAQRQAHLLLIKNTVGGVAKVAAVLVLPVTGVESLTLANLAGLVAAALLTVVLLGPRLTRPLRVRPSVLRGTWSFSVGNHLGMVVGILPLTVTPLLVLSDLGAGPAAHFGIAAMLLGLLNVVPAMLSQSLFAEPVVRPGQPAPARAARGRRHLRAARAVRRRGAAARAVRPRPVRLGLRRRRHHLPALDGARLAGRRRRLPRRRLRQQPRALRRLRAAQRHQRAARRRCRRGGRPARAPRRRPGLAARPVGVGRRRPRRLRGRPARRPDVGHPRRAGRAGRTDRRRPARRRLPGRRAHPGPRRRGRPRRRRAGAPVGRAAALPRRRPRPRRRLRRRRALLEHRLPRRPRGHDHLAAAHQPGWAWATTPSRCSSWCRASRSAWSRGAASGSAGRAAPRRSGAAGSGASCRRTGRPSR
nr:hypothetical protein [Angustibacter aerolatus]